MKLVVGYGNPKCGDDGAGVYAAEKVAEANLANVETRIFNSLPLALISDIHRYNPVVFVDAGVQVPELQLIPVQQVPGDISIALSHALVPGLVTHLSEMLYGIKSNAFVCTILGEDFTPGTGLTEAARQRADRAVEEILKKLS